MTTFEKVGTIAAVVAAGAAIIGVAITWFYGSSARSNAKASLTYERLAEARRLVAEIRRNADNTFWSDVRAHQAQLRSVVKNVQVDLPATGRLAEIEWGPTTYESEGLQGRSETARIEIDDATAALGR